MRRGRGREAAQDVGEEGDDDRRGVCKRGESAGIGQESEGERQGVGSEDDDKRRFVVPERTRTRGSEEGEDKRRGAGDEGKYKRWVGASVKSALTVGMVLWRSWSRG